MLNANRLGYRLPVLEFGLSSAWWGAFFLWHLLAVLLPIRRVSGVFSQPLSGWELVIVVLSVVSVASLLRISAIGLGVRTSEFGQRFIAVLPTIASLLIVGAVSVSTSSPFLVVLAWGVLVASETAWLARIFLTGHAPTRRSSGNSASNTAISVECVAPVSHTQLDADFPSVDDESLPAGVTQQLLRSRHDRGESLSGLLRVDFPIGERTQFVHVAFCPPFADVPEIHVGQVSGPTATVKIAQAESFGMRIEVRRNQTECKPLSLVLEIEATAPLLTI